MTWDFAALRGTVSDREVAAFRAEARATGRYATGIGKTSRFAEASALTYFARDANPSYPGAIFTLGSERAAHDHVRLKQLLPLVAVIVFAAIIGLQLVRLSTGG